MHESRPLTSMNVLSRLGILFACLLFAGSLAAAEKPEPVQYAVSVQNTGTELGILTTVPPDKQLVIEFLSASCISPDREVPEVIVIGVGGPYHKFTLVNYDNGDTTSAYATHPTKLYALPSVEVSAQVYPSSTSASVSCEVVISGYLIDD